MRLFLVRHGQAMGEAINPQRPLSNQGRSEIEKTARFLKQSGLSVDAFYHSGKKRAEETAQIIRQAVHPQASIAVKSYLAPNDDIAFILKDIASWHKDSLIAGHLPFLSILLSRLLTGDEGRTLASMPTGSLAVLERDTNKNWFLISFVAPEML